MIVVQPLVVSTQVSILRRDDEITSSGNILITDGENRIRMEWGSDKDLRVSNMGSLKIYKQVALYGGINVSYQ